MLITRKKKFLILGEGNTQGLDDTTLTAEKKYSINFIATRKKFCLSLHYNGANSYLFVNGTEIIKFKAKDSEIVANPLCLGNISEDFSVANMKKIGLYGYVYDFSVDYRAIAVDDILDIQKYLMEKNKIILKCLDLLKNVFLIAMTFFGCNAVPLNASECVTMNNQECKIRSGIINVNSNEPSFYPFSISVNKCYGS